MRRGYVAAIGLVVISALCAESLSGYDNTTGDPVALLGGLLIFGPLYGCPALLIRELARRWGTGWPGILALGAAFGLFEAGVVDQSLFSMSYRQIDYWDDMLLPTLIEPLGFAPYLLMIFVVGHVVFSFGVPIALVEGVAGPNGQRPWLRWPGLVVAAVLYAGAAALVLGDHLSKESDHASAAQIVATLAVVALLVVVPWATRHRAPAVRRDMALPRPYAVGVLVFVAAVGYALLPPTWLGFGLGVAILAVTAALVARAARSTRWGGRYVVTVAGAAYLSSALVAFLITPLGDVPAGRKYAHNAFFLLAGLVLIAVAARRGRPAAAVDQTTSA